VDQRRIDEVLAARASRLDEARPGAVESVHAAGRITARERIDLLLDPGSGVEYGVIAARSNDPPGWVGTSGGVDFVGTIDGQPVVASSTDFSDRGGDYGAGRLPRLYALALEHRWPVVQFLDGGGTRAKVPGGSAADLALLSGPIGRFSIIDGMAELSGWAPTAAIVSGPSFAGHASLAAFSDFLVATRGSAIGMGGPPMVEVALGIRLTAQELAPVEMHEQLGGIDLLVDDEPAAIAAVRRYLSYYQDLPAGEPSRRAGEIGSLVPDAGAYDMRPVVEAICDDGSVFELKPKFAASVITALARLAGRTVGVIASQPDSPLGGAIDPNAADKIARFVEVCDAYEYPLLALIDSPGFVTGAMGDRGPEPGVTRHHARPLLAHHHRTVPVFAVQIRRGAGLAPFALSGFTDARVPGLRLAWPTVELGRPDGFSKSLRDRNAFDDVVDPAETRDRIVRVLRLMRRSLERPEKKHPIDGW